MLATLSNRTRERFSEGLRDLVTLFQHLGARRRASVAHAQPFLACRLRDPFCSSQTQLPSLSNNVHEFRTFFNEKILMDFIGGFQGNISDT
jgi:hypothetical protein